ncbi:TetR-like C-terminal domain-containing protein [Nocardia sp. NPDC004168]|uniref:TetR-like C-terminal domain-containing protein n=1 Tax=Nocardia sp. NPDC004168 TaxID=3154452 RepID=UPI0033B90136
MRLGRHGRSPCSSCVRWCRRGGRRKIIAPARHAAADSPLRVARAYLDFAVANPSLYDAMFLMNTALTFGLEAQLPLRAAFGELEAMFRPFVDAPDLGARTEVAWSSLHGLATLGGGGRLRPELRDRRLVWLVAERLAAVGAARA